MASAADVLLLENGDLETITRGRLARGQLLVKDGRIAALGKRVAAPRGAKRFDLKGAFVTPGLIDAHSHVGMMEDGVPGDGDYNESTDAMTPDVMALDAFRTSDVALREAAESGVTAAFIMPGSANVIGGLCAIVKTFGLRYVDYIVNAEAGFKMALGENPKRTHGGKGKRPGTRMGIAAMIRQVFADAEAYAQKRTKLKKGDPAAPDLKLESVARMLAGKLTCRCHAHRGFDMLAFMRIADRYKFRYVFEHATEALEVMDELAARKIPIAFGPTFGSRGKIETQSKAWSTPAAAAKAGVLCAITGDHSVTPLRHLCVYAALAVRAGLSNADALKTITINPAKILGVEHRLGSLEPGKDADLVVWPGDPLDIRNAPTRVMIGGGWVDEYPVPTPALYRK